jgi:hypothetical protein
MPVNAPGALFSVGDAHAAQRQGEVDLTAIETGLRGKLQRAETPTHWIFPQGLVSTFALFSSPLGCRAVRCSTDSKVL